MFSQRAVISSSPPVVQHQQIHNLLIISRYMLYSYACIIYTQFFFTGLQRQENFCGRFFFFFTFLLHTQQQPPAGRDVALGGEIHLPLLLRRAGGSR